MFIRRDISDYLCPFSQDLISFLTGWKEGTYRKHHIHLVFTLFINKYFLIIAIISSESDVYMVSRPSAEC